MKILVCYNDSPYKALHKTIRMTLPKQFVQTSTSILVLHQFIKSYNVMFTVQLKQEELQLFRLKKSCQEDTIIDTNDCYIPIPLDDFIINQIQNRSIVFVRRCIPHDKGDTAEVVMYQTQIAEDVMDMDSYPANAIAVREDESDKSMPSVDQTKTNYSKFISSDHSTFVVSNKKTVNNDEQHSTIVENNTNAGVMNENNSIACAGNIDEKDIVIETSKDDASEAMMTMTIPLLDTIHTTATTATTTTSPTTAVTNYTTTTVDGHYTTAMTTTAVDDVHGSSTTTTPCTITSNKTGTTDIVSSMESHQSLTSFMNKFLSTAAIISTSAIQSLEKQTIEHLKQQFLPNSEATTTTTTTTVNSNSSCKDESINMMNNTTYSYTNEELKKIACTE